MGFSLKGKVNKNFLAYLSILFLLNISSAFGQLSEIGVGIGGMNYTGDLIKNYKILNNRPGATVFFRSNYSEAISIRYGLTGGQIVGSDAGSDDALAARRNFSFKSILIEGSAVLEYHFLNFRHPKSLNKFSPFFFAGVGVFTTFNQTPPPSSQRKYGRKFQPSFPIGIGAKYKLNPKWILGLEFGARKTFFDYLDYTSDPSRIAVSDTGGNPQSGALEGPSSSNPYGNIFDKDWYYFLGVTISYTFYSIPCPFDYQ